MAGMAVRVFFAEGGLVEEDEFFEFLLGVVFVVEVEHGLDELGVVEGFFEVVAAGFFDFLHSFFVHAHVLELLHHGLHGGEAGVDGGFGKVDELEEPFGGSFLFLIGGEIEGEADGGGED